MPMDDDRRPQPETTPSFIEPYASVVTALQNKHAHDITAFDVSKVSGFADVILMATSRSEINARSLLDAASDALDALDMPHKVEGATGARWILLDAGDLIVNIFSPQAREFYKLERIWGDMPSVQFEDAL